MTKKDIINELVKHKQEMQNDFGWNTTVQTALDEAIKVLRLIPDNATNGDVIKALFLVKAIEELGYCTFASIAGDGDMRVFKDWWDARYEAKRDDKLMTKELEIVQALPSLYPLTETEEKAVMHITTRQPVEFVDSDYDDRAEMYPVCPNCKEYLSSEDWEFCPYCGVPIE